MSEAPGAVPEEPDAVQRALIEWYEADHRSFPWRETTDPYEILVSEVMSQQTQLSRVETAWAEFLDRWPAVADLAAADRSAVVAFWTDHSLGYNNRARYLHEAAGQVVDDHGGETLIGLVQKQNLDVTGKRTSHGKHLLFAAR